MSRAAEKGDEAVVELLLKNGAQPDLEDEKRCTALSRAIEEGHALVVQLLLAQGVKVNFCYKVVSKSPYPNRSILDSRLTLSSFTIAVGK